MWGKRGCATNPNLLTLIAPLHGLSSVSKAKQGVTKLQGMFQHERLNGREFARAEQRWIISDRQRNGGLSEGENKNI